MEVVLGKTRATFFLCFRDRQMALHVYVCQISGRRTRMGGRGDFVRLRTENRLAENEKSFAAD